MKFDISYIKFIKFFVAQHQVILNFSYQNCKLNIYALNQIKFSIICYLQETQE